MTEAGLAGYVDNLPAATVTTLEGAGHFSFSDTPEEFAEVVRRFLEK